MSTLLPEHSSILPCQLCVTMCMPQYCTGKPLLWWFLLRRIRFNTNYNLQPCPPIAWLNFDLTLFFKIKCSQKCVPHPSNMYRIVCVRYRTSTLKWEQAASRALPLVLEKYLRTSLASALAASRRVCCALLISRPSTAPRHAHARWLPTRKLMMVLKHP